MGRPFYRDIFSFAGRRSRGAYLASVVAQTIALILIVVPVVVLLDALQPNQPDLVIGIVSMVLFVPWFCSHLALGVQRCHDIGWSGGYVLIALVPGFGPLFWLWVIRTRGVNGANQYGPDPIQRSEGGHGAGIAR